MSSSPPLEAAPRLVPVSNVTARPVDWLWPNRLALGKLAVLEGDPGLSKSFLALDLCARLSTGRPWPDGGPACAPAACLFLNGEDGVEDTIRPRLAALGADLTRVFVVERGDGDLAAPLSLPAQTEALDALVGRAQARLLVIDPIMTFFDGGVNTSCDKAVRRALAPLAALAHRHGCAVLLIRHLNKLGGGRAIHRGLGSMGLVGVCRSGWLVAEEKEASPRRVLAQVKNNLAPPQPSLAFELAQSEGQAATLNWLGPVDATADGLLGRPRRMGREPTALEAATAFLAAALANGPLKVAEVWKRATERGVTRRTLARAKDELDVRSEWVTEEGRPVSYWLLPHQQAPRPLVDDENSLEPWLAPLREKFPPPCPLDDL
jgi:hypothetical protein